jgi:hypothetical protein
LTNIKKRLDDEYQEINAFVLRVERWPYSAKKEKKSTTRNKSDVHHKKKLQETAAHWSNGNGGRTHVQVPFSRRETARGLARAFLMVTTDSNRSLRLPTVRYVSRIFRSHHRHLTTRPATDWPAYAPGVSGTIECPPPVGWADSGCSLVKRPIGGRPADSS